MKAHARKATATQLPLGETLVERGVITRAQLTEALARQEQEGSPLGRMLTAEGDISRRDLFAALADSWGLDLVDLIADPPAEDLMHDVGHDVMLRGHWVPHRVLEEIDERGTTRVLVVATAERPSPELDAAIHAHLDVDSIHYKVTTDWDIDQAVLLACQAEVVDAAAYGLAESAPELSAREGWWRWQKIAALASLAALAVAFALAPRPALMVSLLAINLMFLVGVAFKLVTCLRGMLRLRRDDVTPVEEDPRRGRAPLAVVPRLDDHELPVYTILVPAYREANIVAKVIDHVRALDYPMSKLQVLLLMEADDVETIGAARAARPPDCVRFVVVPPGGPQTKPRACNVGLALAEGELLVIYDAEDLPEPGQLREVVARMADADDDVVCLQARLNYFNAEENILTRMFTLEYSFWFDYMLPGLDAWRLPIPLGGTSNHFRVDKLRELGGWDPYNVTEDADLGIRAAAVGMTVGITESTTWEEACSEWKAWIRQRTRWIKGYMTTTLVHTRDPRKLWRTTGARGLTGLVGLIAGTPAMFLACPLVWGFWLYTFLGGSISGFHLPDWVQTATTFNLVVGNGAMILLMALAARRRRATHLMLYALLAPAYWMLHSIAAWRALYQLVRNPAHWEKTPHGIVHGPAAFAPAA